MHTFANSSAAPSRLCVKISLHCTGRHEGSTHPFPPSLSLPLSCTSFFFSPHGHGLAVSERISATAVDASRVVCVLLPVRWAKQNRAYRFLCSGLMLLCCDVRPFVADGWTLDWAQWDRRHGGRAVFFYLFHNITHSKKVLFYYLWMNHYFSIFLMID